ncbi:actin-related protein 2/3 complex subunit 1A-like [Dorcoceras hygrometricum]|uniref:Actin-related protein 2/3 complex subunit 1A-like n=1 Tax=Dorcoceras hygrometricum TaxID=472368 RepID=A0A2Z7CFI8_9LAMI|nr:actin-related protein 2/3 complex subunit 1A-like [Dorcoceras hygrometricum]
MASSLINKPSQIYFNSVYGMDYEGMVKMFKALEEESNATSNAKNGDRSRREMAGECYGETDFEEPVVVDTSETTTVETESRIDVPAITNYDEDSSIKVLSNEEGPLVETEREEEKEKEIELVMMGMSLEKITDSEDTEPLSKVLELTVKSMSDEESMSIDDLLVQIPGDMMLPSVASA